MKDELQIRIGKGRVRFLYDDALLGLMGQGNATTRRASHVEPAADGGWNADLSPVGGPVLGPYGRRQEALDAERKWIHKHGIPAGS